MTYKLYIMTFQNAHFGSGTLDSSKLTFGLLRMFILVRALLIAQN